MAPNDKISFRSPRVGELVADELRRRIVSGELPTELPRESELLAEFGVSRPSLREAFRILETEGLLRVRRGKVGGAVVQAPTAEGAAYHLGLVLQSERASLSDLATARLHVEPACAAMAAGHADHEAIAAELTGLIDENAGQIGPPSADFTVSAQRFHAAVVRLCGNVTLQLLAGALEAVWNAQEQAWAERAVARGVYPDEAAQRQVVAAHRRIAKYIARGDADGARRATHAHLDESQAVLDGGEQPIAVVRADFAGAGA